MVLSRKHMAGASLDQQIVHYESVLRLPIAIHCDLHSWQLHRYLFCKIGWARKIAKNLMWSRYISGDVRSTLYFERMISLTDGNQGTTTRRLLPFVIPYREPPSRLLRWVLLTKVLVPLVFLKKCQWSKGSGNVPVNHDFATCFIHETRHHKWHRSQHIL